MALLDQSYKRLEMMSTQLVVLLAKRVKPAIQTEVTQ